MSASKSKADKWDISDVKIEKFNYQWTITNFSFLCMEPGEKLESPVFSFGSKSEIHWYIRLYPKGNKEGEGHHLSLFLVKDCNTVLKGTVHMSLLSNEKDKQYSKEYFDLSSVLSNGQGWTKFIEREVLLNSAKDFLPNNCLTINCEIVVTGEVNTMNVNKKQKLNNPGSSWVEKIFLEDYFSDVRLVTNTSGESLSAHRSVLAACSPVFEAMFKNDMLEQKLGIVKIEDGKYEVVKEMLRFIYLGKVEDESVTLELLELAHKYQITDLIQKCGESLSKQISADNVLKIITLANLYEVDDLKVSAIKFARTNINDVVKSDDFKSPKNNQALQYILEEFAQYFT